ncbi:Arginyl-tRNA synthetase [Mycoplasmopsis agalactiae 14628]|uniref:Arginine--tRNA ligase n=1 Tax=Mycoplasmopsis agalactiae 14628 TaxID=1110504 RepID=I5D6X5_MYCAA|nr:arginine--tRNA ligase [Mycoplasmopsis agalactiae]EIN15434.1 Arginyl-tRNA synthetase [Mycoplasmopsis agalactiae 14628]
MNKLDLKEKLESKLKEIASSLGITRSVFLTESKKHGDLTTNMALGNINTKPMELAQQIVSMIKPEEFGIKNISVANPGFINFSIGDDYLVSGVNQILKLGQNYGKGNKVGKVNVEFISANPTGFLHVGHARNAAVGSTIANILEFAGYSVVREYYINDAGNQINVLANSLWSRYKQIFYPDYSMPEESYKGEDIVWGAQKFYAKYGDKFKNSELDNKLLELVKNEAISIFMAKIQEDLANFGVWFDNYFSEKSLYENNEVKIKETIKSLKNAYENDGALWLKTTIHGDDKDRVLVKSDGSYTYFLPDIVYHQDKYKRMGSDAKIINVWGADHSGYVKRMQCAVKDLGLNEQNLVVLCMQLVRLIKNGEEFKMSKRKGTSFFLNEFVKMVGKDSARFLLLDRTLNSKLDFDIDLATSQSNDNPAILVQYANARCHSLIKKANIESNNLYAASFDKQSDNSLITTLLEFPSVVEKSADKYATHLLTQYLVKLAKEFNSWYTNSPKLIGSDNEISKIALVKAVSITIENGLKLLEVSAPESM